MFTTIGLAVVLGMLLVAFNWTTRERSVGDLGQVIAIDLEEEMIATEQEQKPEPPPPPPPPQETVIEELIVVDNKENVADIEINTEVTEETMIVQTDITIQAEETEDEPEVFLVVEQQPEFPGGMASLMKYLQSNIKYPQIAKENGVSGKVFVNFVVDNKGNITKIKVLRGVDPSLDSEAVRVVENMPRWTPGKQRGKAVYVSYNLPISFVLQ
ncbi:MAG: TonB family protein [Salinivirgaceae bacterium]|nr:TonB family protein [Salinivirgaceae bacterium]MDD4747988.1 TonB family protein [Salinivirgaceae bacterium]